MSAVKGRSKRPNDTTAYARKPIFANVQTANHAKASRAASALGISMAGYLDLLLSRDPVDENGRPLWAPAEVSTFEELRDVS